jgi:hypothetical protein
LVGRVSLVQRAAEKNSSRLPAVPQVATYRILLTWPGLDLENGLPLIQVARLLQFIKHPPGYIFWRRHVDIARGHHSNPKNLRHQEGRPCRESSASWADVP